MAWSRTWLLLQDAAAEKDASAVSISGEETLNQEARDMAANRAHQARHTPATSDDIEMAQYLCYCMSCTAMRHHTANEVAIKVAHRRGSCAAEHALTMSAFIACGVILASWNRRHHRGEC